MLTTKHLHNINMLTVAGVAFIALSTFLLRIPSTAAVTVKVPFEDFYSGISNGDIVRIQAKTTDDDNRKVYVTRISGQTNIELNTAVEGGEGQHWRYSSQTSGGNADFIRFQSVDDDNYWLRQGGSTSIKAEAVVGTQNKWRGDADFFDSTGFFMLCSPLAAGKCMCRLNAAVETVTNPLAMRDPTDADYSLTWERFAFSLVPPWGGTVKSLIHEDGGADGDRRLVEGVGIISPNGRWILEVLGSVTGNNAGWKLKINPNDETFSVSPRFITVGKRFEEGFSGYSSEGVEMFLKSNGRLKLKNNDGEIWAAPWPGGDKVSYSARVTDAGTFWVGRTTGMTLGRTNLNRAVSETSTVTDVLPHRHDFLYGALLESHEVVYDTNGEPGPCISGDGGEGGSATVSENILFGLNSLATLVAPFGKNTGVAIYTVLSLSTSTWSMFGGDPGSSSIDDQLISLERCIKNYVDWRVGELIDGQTIADVTRMLLTFETFAADVGPDNELSNHLGKWDDSGVLHLRTVGDLTTGMASDPRHFMPLAVTFMTMRISYWNQLITSVSTGPQVSTMEQLVQWMTDHGNEALGEMANFRTDNGKIMRKYMDYLPAAWLSIMQDAKLTTHERHAEIETIWMDGAFCKSWIPQTYEMSREQSGSTQISAAADLLEAHRFSYVFDGFDFDGDGIGFSSVDACLRRMADYISNNANGYNSLGDTPVPIWWDTRSLLGPNNDPGRIKVAVDDYNSGTDNFDRCLTAPTTASSTSMCPPVGSGTYGVGTVSVRTVTNSKMNDGREWLTVTKPQFWKYFPLVQQLDIGQTANSLDCNSDGASATGTVEQLVQFWLIDHDNMSFWLHSAEDQCWNNGVWLELPTFTTCDFEAGWKVTGLSFYGAHSRMGGYTHRGQNHNAGDVYLFWKARAMCRRISHQDSRPFSMGDYWEAPMAGGDPANLEYDTLTDPGWSAFYECPPGRMLVGLETEGWENSNHGEYQDIFVKYRVRLICDFYSLQTGYTDAVSPENAAPFVPVAVHVDDRIFKFTFDEFARWVLTPMLMAMLIIGTLAALLLNCKRKGVFKRNRKSKYEAVPMSAEDQPLSLSEAEAEAGADAESQMRSD